MRLEVEAEVKPHGVTTRDEGGQRVRGEVWLLWRDVERGGEDRLDSGWSREEREVLTGERFPSCCRCHCRLREEDGVAGGQGNDNTGGLSAPSQHYISLGGNA